jgi:hypothetical protein
MARFEVDVKMIVEAYDETDAGSLVRSALEGIEGDDILEGCVDAVTDLSIVSKEEEYLEIAAELNKD